MEQHSYDKIIIIDNFINDIDANNIISLLNNKKDTNKDLFIFPPDKRVVLREPKIKEFQEFILKYGNMAIDYCKNDPSFSKDVYFSDFLFAISETGAHMNVHDDHTDLYGKQVVSILLYLNDDFGGGEIFFPENGLTYKPKKYSAIIFPGSYKHGVTPILGGTRYSVGIGTTAEKDKQFKFTNWGE